MGLNTPSKGLSALLILVVRFSFRFTAIFEGFQAFLVNLPETLGSRDLLKDNKQILLQ